MVNETAGEDWLHPTGSASAPRLLNDLLHAAHKCHRRYSGPDYFTLD
jgi:hypothetical protein